MRSNTRGVFDIASISTHVSSLLFVLCLLSLAAVQTIAIGISPADIIVRPSDPQEFTFTPVLNGETGAVTARVEGDFSQYITLASNTIAPGGSIRGTIDLPEDVAPGVHDQRIIISLSAANAGTVGAGSEVAGILSIRLPYPDVYLRGDLAANNDPGTDVALITMTLENLGSRAALTDAISIDVVDTFASDRTVDMIPLPPTAVAQGSFAQAMTSYPWTLSLATPGEYLLRARVPYESSALSFEKNATFGSPRIDITSLAYRDEAGSIKPVDVTVTTRWNHPLPGTLEIYYDDSTSPALRKEVQLLSSVQERVYLDTAVLGTPMSTIRAVVRTGQVATMSEIPLGAIAPESAPLIKNSTLLIIAALVVIALLIYLVLRIRKP